MARSRDETLGKRALMVHSELHDQSAAGRAARRLMEHLQDLDIDVVEAISCADATVVFASDASLQAVLLDFDIEGDADHQAALAVISAIRARNAAVPIFLCADRSLASTIPLEAMGQVDDFIWLLEDTPRFIAGRVDAAIARYR
eukprot:gene5191-6472_t